MLIIENNGVFFQELNFSGTFVAIKMSTTFSDGFPNLLSAIVERGENETEIETGIKKKASRSSRIAWQKAA
jgi:hypothetical protein